MKTSNDSQTASPQSNLRSRLSSLLEKVTAQDGILTPGETKELADIAETLQTTCQKLQACLDEEKSTVEELHQSLEDWRHTHQPYTN